jgi:hypothetical protein
MSLYGDVTINGDTDRSGYTLTAIDESGTEVGRIEVSDGSYGGSGPYESKLDVECVCDDGETIRFVISGTQAEQTVAFGSGEVKEQDLTVTDVTTPTPTPAPSTDESSDGGGGGGTGGSSGGTGGGGSSAASSGGDPGSTSPTETPVPDNPSTIERVPIVDNDPQTTGTTVDVSESGIVRRVTFDGNVSGTLNISEIALNVSETDDIEAQFDGTGISVRRIVSAVDISPDSNKVAETAATVELSVPRDNIDDPANVFVVHRTEDGWERLDVIERQVSNERVTLVAETESFSAFAAVEIEETATPTPQTETPTADDVSTTSTTSVDTVSSDGTQQPGMTPDAEAGGFGLLPVFGLVAAVLGVTAGVVILRRSDL